MKVIQKQYTNFEFYEIKIHKHLENIWIYKAKQFIFTKNNFKQRICILEDGASGGASGVIEEIIVKNLFQIQLRWPQVYNEFKEYEKKFQVQNI
jgi:hypothetical protein